MATISVLHITSPGQPVCENNHQFTEVHFMVKGQYVEARFSKTSKKVELTLVEEQGKPDCVQRFTCIRGEKKYLAFRFTHGTGLYSLTLEGETPKLVFDNGKCPSVFSWFEMKDIKAGESHHLNATAVLIGLQSDRKDELDVGGTQPEIFTQIPYS